MEKLKEFYSKLPKEVKVFFEYILPSAIISATIEYLGKLQINDIYVNAVVNLVLIFLREIKPRLQRI